MIIQVVNPITKEGVSLPAKNFNAGYTLLFRNDTRAVMDREVVVKIPKKTELHEVLLEISNADFNAFHNIPEDVDPIIVFPGLGRIVFQKTNSEVNFPDIETLTKNIETEVGGIFVEDYEESSHDGVWVKSAYKFSGDELVTQDIIYGVVWKAKPTTENGWTFLEELSSDRKQNRLLRPGSRLFKIGTI